MTLPYIFQNRTYARFRIFSFVFGMFMVVTDDDVTEIMKN